VPVKTRETMHLMAGLGLASMMSGCVAYRSPAERMRHDGATRESEEMARLVVGLVNLPDDIHRHRRQR
jgi:hypothetical protein